MVTDPAPGEAVVYIVSKSSNTTHRRVLWRMTLPDAQRVCSDTRTSGENYMLVWTATAIDDPAVNRYVPDNGQHAHVLAELGVTVLRSHATNGRRKSRAD